MKETRRAYFGKIVWRGTEEREEEKRKKIEEIFYILTLLGVTRHALAHGEEDEQNILYTLGKEFDKKKIEACKEENKAKTATCRIVKMLVAISMQ